MIRLARRVQERQRRSGFEIDQLDISNCVMNMISPRAYRNFIFPYDHQIAGAFERFGVHTCNWDVTPYLAELSQLPKVGYLDMGIMSDLQKARAAFPEARRAVMYSPVRLQDASLAEIRADMRKIWTELSPCDVVMADIQAQTPDRRVHRAAGDLPRAGTNQPLPRCNHERTARSARDHHRFKHPVHCPG